MEKIAYFKLQAKNLMRDFRTQQLSPDGIYYYIPQFFEDIDDLILSFNIDEEHFSLMKAQHLIAYLAGFDKWADLLQANDDALELGKLLFDNRNRYFAALREDWDMYLRQNGLENASDESKLDIFKAIFLKIMG